MARVSLNPAARAAAQQHCDGVLDYEPLLRAYAGVAELHVAHGQRHITEFTHTLLGVAAGQRLLAWRAETKPGLPGSGGAR